MGSRARPPRWGRCGKRPKRGERGAAATPSVFDRAADRIEQETRERWQLDVHDVTALAYADNVIERDRLASDAAARHN